MNEKIIFGLDLSVQEGSLTEGRITSSSSQKKNLPKAVDNDQVEVVLEEQVLTPTKPREQPPKRHKIVAKNSNPHVPNQVRQNSKLKIAKTVLVPSNEDFPLVLSDEEELPKNSLKEPTPLSSPKIPIILNTIPSIYLSSFSVLSSYEQMKVAINEPNPLVGKTVVWALNPS